MPDPIVERNVLKFPGSEHFQKDQIAVAGVLDIVACEPQISLRSQDWRPAPRTKAVTLESL